MGDDLDTSAFEIDEDFSNVIGESASDVEEEEDLAKKLKKDKKKRKIEELKSIIVGKKIRKDENDLLEISEIASNTSETQFNKIMEHLPEINACSFTLQAHNFLGLSNTNTKELNTENSCPFVSAISLGVRGSYKKLLKKQIDVVGCPHILIVCAGANRASEVISSISKKLKCRVAKLYARHFKVEEQITMLKNPFPVAVGTPARIHKLIQLGALSLLKTKLVLIDLSRDTKNFNLLEMKDIRTDFYTFLTDDVIPEKSHLKIALIEPTT